MNRVKPPSTERGLERIEHRTKNRLRNPLDRWTTLRWNTELRRNLSVQMVMGLFIGRVSME